MRASQSLVDLPPEIQSKIWRLVCEGRYTVDPDVEQMTTRLPAAAGIMKVIPYTVGPYYFRTLHLKMHQAARYNPDWDPEEEDQDQDEDEEEHGSEDDEEHDSDHDGVHHDEEPAQNQVSAHHADPSHNDNSTDNENDNSTHDETPAQHVDSAPHHADSPSTPQAPSLHAGTWINRASATYFRTATISLTTGYRQGGPDGERAGAYGRITARFLRRKIALDNKKTKIVRALKLTGYCHVVDREDDPFEEYEDGKWTELGRWERGVEARMQGRGQGGCGLLYYGDCLWLLGQLENELEYLVQNGPESEEDD